MTLRLFALRALLLAAALPPIVRAVRSSPPQFRVAALHRVADSAPFYQAEFLPPVRTTFVHGATMAEMPNGDLAAAFYGGSDETLRDVGIYLSFCDHRSGRWSEPRIIEDGPHTQSALRLHVKSVGNPVLYADAAGVRLFFVAIITGGWSGATICVKSSPDALHWSEPQPVITSPFFNIGMLVRSSPVPYDDGTLALPIYHQFARKWSAIARVDRDGHVLDQRRIDDRRPMIQPWMVVTGPATAIAFLRYSALTPGSVTYTRTSDAGGHWSEVSGTPLLHRDSAVAAARLPGGSMLTVWNNSGWDRRDLSVGRLFEDGMRWSKPHPLVRDTLSDSVVRREYSYPYVIRTQDGRTHVVFTWQRTKIQHIVFNDAWVEADPLLRQPR
jgi:predicted neuraminidase